MSDPLPRNAATIDLSSQQALRAGVTYLNEDEDAHPLGVRVVEPPPDTNQAVRGSLFAIIEVKIGDAREAPPASDTPARDTPASDAHASDLLVEKMLSALQRSYYTLRGSQSAVLAEAMRNAHALVNTYNEAHADAPLSVSIACATLLKSRLMVSCTGAAFMILRNGERVELYPNEPGALRPVAPNDPRSYEVLRWDLSAGDVILLAAAGWADRVTMRTLAATVFYLEPGMAQEAAQGLQEQGGKVNAPGLLLEIKSDTPPPARPRTPVNPLTGSAAPPAPSAPPRTTPSAPPAAATQPHAAAPAAAPATTNPLTSPARASGAGLPTALGAAPPVRAPDLQSRQAAAQAASAPPASAPPPQQHAQPQPIQDIPEPVILFPPQEAQMTAADAPASAVHDPAVATPMPAFPEPRVPSSAVLPVPDMPARAEAAEASSGRSGEQLRASASEGLGRFFRTMLPDKGGAVPHEYELLDNAEHDADSAAGSYAETAPAASQAARAAVAAPDVARMPVFTPPAPASGGRARLIISVAILIALLIPVAVGAWAWQMGEERRSEAQQLVELAAARTISAGELLNMGDDRSALNALSEAQALLDRAEELVGPSTPMNDLRAEMRRLEIDAAAVQPLYALMSPLVHFPEGAAASKVLLISQDIYVLDTGRNVVERYHLDETLENVPDGVGLPVIQSGQVIEGATVGPLLDMAMLPVVPGYDDRATLVVLDANNQIFRYDPRVEGAMKLDAGGAATFESVRQLEVYQGRLYAADIGLGQVLRYDAGLYTRAPTPWFSQSVNLDEMKSMQIDGDIWMLMRNGQVLRFNQGRQQPFALDSSVGLVREAVDFYVGGGTNPYIYVADSAGERVWVYDKVTGEYQKQFAAPEGNPLRGLSSIYIEGVDAMYLLTATDLYKHPFILD